MSTLAVSARRRDRLESLSQLQSLPITAPTTPGMANGQVLTNIASVSRTSSQPIYSHYNVIPVVDIYGNVANRDLGGVLRDIKPIIADARKNLPREFLSPPAAEPSMSSSFTGLALRPGHGRSH